MTIIQYFSAKSNAFFERHMAFHFRESTEKRVTDFCSLLKGMQYVGHFALQCYFKRSLGSRSFLLTVTCPLLHQYLLPKSGMPYPP